ncbi:hypothetical protein BC829DRAFT_168832 [Chytridium lagenaria]|nr:hypothetical protein BC829DRAFT_168832 [Chytridium lagenaria]
MGDLGDPDLGSNFGSQVGTRAQGEEMVREFMHYFGDAARSTSEESGKPVRIFPTSLSSASLTHDPTVHEKKPNERKPISTNWFKTPSVLRGVPWKLSGRCRTSQPRSLITGGGFRKWNSYGPFYLYHVGKTRSRIPSSSQHRPQHLLVSAPNPTHTSPLPDHRHRSSSHHVCASFHEVCGRHLWVCAVVECV